MTYFEKHIAKSEGFTLVEVLVGLFCLSFCMLISVQLVMVLAKFPKETYQNDDRIAIRQIQKMFAESSEIVFTEEQLQFLYRQQWYVLDFRQRRLVKTPGYEIFLKDVEAGSFYQQGGCSYARWMRAIEERVILYCE